MSLSELSVVQRTEANAFLSSQCKDAPLSTAQGTCNTPFQRWYHFKEAFSPQFVADVINEMPTRPKKVCDPFGGSGTTSITSQFLGMQPVTMEVNPFLADLIEAKLAKHDASKLTRTWTTLVSRANAAKPDLHELYSNAPPSLCEPGDGEKWIFDKPILRRIAQLRQAIDGIRDPHQARLFRVLLASVLVPVSNVVISGKGRRYRRNWQSIERSARLVDVLFYEQLRNAIYDISRFQERACWNYTLLRGDSRIAIQKAPKFDLAVFSPPYPNSFDYTDIYNLELWVLGYLSSKTENRKLREATLRSHVQIKREYSEPPKSKSLASCLRALNKCSNELWNSDIPNMVASYFEDMRMIMSGVKDKLSDDGRMVMVVGNSQYAGVSIDVSKILGELASEMEFNLIKSEKIRSMRSSPQQGGREELSETALYFSLG